MEFRRSRSRLPRACHFDRFSVDLHHGMTICWPGDECLTGRISLLDREGAFLEGQALRPDGLDQDRAGNPLQDSLLRAGSPPPRRR